MKAEEINNLLVNAGAPTLGTEVYYGKKRIRCIVVGVYDSKTAKGFMPIIRAADPFFLLEKSDTFNSEKDMHHPDDASTVGRSVYAEGDKPVLNDEFLYHDEYVKEVDKRIVEGLAKLNMKIGDVVEVEVLNDILNWNVSPTQDLSLKRRSLIVIGLDQYENPVVKYEKGWEVKNDGNGKIHSSHEKETKGWSIRANAIITKEMKAKKADSEIIKGLEKTKFILGQKVYVSRFNDEKELHQNDWMEVQRANKNNSNDKKDYLEGTIVGYDGRDLIIKNDENLGRWATDIGYFDYSPIHSTADRIGANYIVATPLAVKTEEDFNQGIEVNGIICQPGSKMFACQLNTLESQVLYSHNNYETYRNLIKEQPSITMEMVQVTLIGKSITGQLIVEYKGRSEYVNRDALYLTSTFPSELVEIEKVRKLNKKGFVIGSKCKFVSANRQTKFTPRPRLFGESDEQYGEYFDSLGCELIWETGTIISADGDLVRIEFKDIDGNFITDKIPLSQIGNLYSKPSEGFAKVMARQKLKKLNMPIGSKRKVLAFPTTDGTWRNSSFDLYTQHMRTRKLKPSWVEVEVIGVYESDNITIMHDGKNFSCDQRAVFDLNADFPAEVQQAFPNHINAFMSKVKLEGTSAGYRIASMQLTAIVRRAIITLLQKTNNDKAQMIGSALDTEIGRAIVGGAIGVLLLQYYPSDKRAQRLAEEFRINALATVGNEAIEALMGEMIPVLISTFSSLPNEERIQILKETTTEFSGILSEPEEETYIAEKSANG